MDQSNFKQALLSSLLSTDYWMGSEQSLLSLVMKLSSTDAVQIAAQQLEQAKLEHSVNEMPRFGGKYHYMMNLYGDIAVIDIRGSLVTYEDPYNKYMGMCSYEEISNAVITATADAAVSKILLKIDSPGGAVSGIDGCIDTLKEINSRHMPIYTFATGTMASAGYFLGSVGRTIYTTKMTTVGSIGVISGIMSYYRALEKEGVDVKMIRSHELKALGHPMDPISDLAIDTLTASIKYMAGIFEQAVAENRGTSVEVVRAKYGNGGTFIGQQAVDNGLADELSSFDRVLLRLRDGNFGTFN